MKKSLLIAFIAIASISYVSAQQPAVETSNKPGWHKIAETTADLKMDRDEVVVLGKDHFKSLKLKVTDVPVEFTTVMVFYENDTKQEIPVSALIKAGGETRVIDLDGKERAIKKVVLVYKSVPNAEKDKSHIEIWGMK